MKTSTIRRIYAPWLLAAVIGLSTFFTITSLNSCATLNALLGISRAQFKIQDAVGVRLVGIDVMSKRSLSDFSITDGIRLTQAFASNSFPLTFTLNVAMKNPNEPDPKVNFSQYSLSSFPWRLLIDDRETISGGIGTSVTLPNPGATTIIPLSISVDIKKFFDDKGYNDIINLALAIGGSGTSSLSLKAQPTLSTPVGAFKYPNEIKIVGTEFRN